MAIGLKPSVGDTASMYTPPAAGVSVMLDMISDSNKEIKRLQLELAKYKAFTDDEKDVKAVDDASERVVDNVEISLVYENRSNSYRVRLSGQSPSHLEHCTEVVINADTMRDMREKGRGIPLPNIFLGFKE